MDVFLMKAHRSRTCPSPKQRIGWEWTSSSCHSSSETRKSFLLYSILLCWNCLSLFCSWFVVYNKKKSFLLLSLFLIWFQYPFLSKVSFQSSLLLITFLTMRHFLKYVVLSYNLKPPIFTSLLFTTCFKLLDHYHMRCTENIKH